MMLSNWKKNILVSKVYTPKCVNAVRIEDLTASSASCIQRLPQGWTRNNRQRTKARASPTPQSGHAKPKSRICLLYKQADAALWLCRAESEDRSLWQQPGSACWYVSAGRLPGRTDPTVSAGLCVLTGTPRGAGIAATARAVQGSRCRDHQLKLVAQVVTIVGSL